MLTVGEHLALWRKRMSLTARDIAGNKCGLLTSLERNLKVRLDASTVDRILSYSNALLFDRETLLNPTADTVTQRNKIALLNPNEALWLTIKYDSTFAEMTKRTGIITGTLNKIASQYAKPNSKHKEILEKILLIRWDYP